MHYCAPALAAGRHEPMIVGLANFHRVMHDFGPSGKGKGESPACPLAWPVVLGDPCEDAENGHFSLGAMFGANSGQHGLTVGDCEG